MIHPEKYKQQSFLPLCQKKQAKDVRNSKFYTNWLMYRRRRKRKTEKEYSQGFDCNCIGAVTKSSSCFHPAVVRKPYQPSSYTSWNEDRKKLWDQIPFNANEYYMHFLPPGIDPQPSEWSENEIAEFQSLLVVRLAFLLEL